VLELLEGRLSVQFALHPIDATCAPAISGVIEDKRGDTVGGQKLLHGKPAANGFSNAVADEDCSARRACGRLPKYCVKGVFSAGDGMPGNGLIGECAAWTDAEEVEDAVSKNEKPNNAGEGKSEGSAVVGHQTENPQLISAW
jgi:hypothetical protein